MTQALSLVQAAIEVESRIDTEQLLNRTRKTASKMHEFGALDKTKKFFEQHTPNTMLRLKPHFKDVIAARELAEGDALQFSKFCGRIASMMQRSPYYCISWWYQGLLAIGISAAQARIEIGMSVDDQDLENLDSAISHVEHAYDLLLGKLKKMSNDAASKSVLSRIKRKLLAIFSKIKQLVNSLASKIQDDSKKDKSMLHDVVRVGISGLISGLLRISFGSFAASIAQLMSSKLFSKVKINSHDLLSDRIVKYIGRAAEGVKLHTRPDFSKAFYGSGTDDPRLYGVILQIQREVNAAAKHADLSHAFDTALKMVAEKRVNLAGRSAEAIESARDVAKTNGFYSYQSPSGWLYLFKGDGNNRELGHRLYEAFADEAAKAVIQKTRQEKAS